MRTPPVKLFDFNALNISRVNVSIVVVFDGSHQRNRVPCGQRFGIITANF